MDERRISVVYDGVPAGSEARGGSEIIAAASDDPLKGSELLRKAAALAGIPVRFSRDLAADLPRAAALAYITHSEGLGSAALLAMASGVPVIASRTGGLPEIVEDGVTGFLVENTPEAVAGALARIIESPGLRRILGEAGRARVAEKFSIGEMVRATEAVYHRVLAC